MGENNFPAILDNDVNITLEDQQKISFFAVTHGKYRDLKEQIDIKKNEIKNLDDALLELELVDDDEIIPYQFGQIFLDRTAAQCRELLQHDKKKFEQQINENEAISDEMEEKLKSIKIYLYERFDKKINLEYEGDYLQ